MEPVNRRRHQLLIATSAMGVVLAAVPFVKSMLPSERAKVLDGPKFDQARRVSRNVPAPTNLVVPPHHCVGDARIVISAGGLVNA